MKNIILLCAAGMSTSLLVKKMQEAAASENYECTIDAFPVSEAEKVCASADVVLVGPQVRYLVKKLVGKLTCPVEAIDMSAYGTMDGTKVLQQVKKILGE